MNTFYECMYQNHFNPFLFSVVHTGNREFSCPHCTQRFGRKVEMSENLKILHTNKIMVIIVLLIHSLIYYDYGDKELKVQ